MRFLLPTPHVAVHSLQGLNGDTEHFTYSAEVSFAVDAAALPTTPAGSPAAAAQMATSTPEMYMRPPRRRDA